MVMRASPSPMTAPSSSVIVLAASVALTLYVPAVTVSVMWATPREGDRGGRPGR